MKTCLRKRKAFTLIEMIVVIAIIAMLVGLLFPAIGQAIRVARRARAKTEVVNLHTAFRAYYAEFGRWPTNLMDSIQITTNTFANSRGITFYDYSLKDVDLLTGYYQDPWKRSYWFRVDHDYNNQIASPFHGDRDPVRAGVLVWSFGPDADTISLSRKKNDPENRYVVTSW